MDDCPPSLPTEPSARARALVQCVGPHLGRRLGLDLSEPDDTILGRWLVAALLLGGRNDEDTVRTAFAALDAAQLATPAALAASSPGPVESVLLGAGLRRSDEAAARLHRASQTLQRDYAGSLEGLAAEAEDFHDLGSRLCALTPGLGGATAARFLAPLRAHWVAAGELPLDAAACAAARHLGWLGEFDEEVDAATLARTVALEDADHPSLWDVEAALQRLGRAACLRERTRRCPLGAQCPRSRVDRQQ